MGPNAGSMQTFDVRNKDSTPGPVIPFAVGDSVYETAWTALTKVTGYAGDKPEPSLLRIALPPST